METEEGQGPQRIKLGLIGDNIAASSAPLFHRLAGQQCGFEVTYDRLVPAEMNLGFDAVFQRCRDEGYRGINVTYPYKEVAAGKAVVADPLVAAIGAINTVTFGPDGPAGHNTDYSGFMAAYRGSMGQERPGTVCLIGTGGVGRAVAFALVRLGAEAIRLVDVDGRKARALADDLTRAAPGLSVTVLGDAAAAGVKADGVINCTPVGMVGKGGTPVQGCALEGARWVFDAVYTPVETEFLKLAAEAGLKVISGYELFFYQAVDAWEIFAGRPLDLARMRQDLLKRQA